MGSPQFHKFHKGWNFPVDWLRIMEEDWRVKQLIEYWINSIEQVNIGWRE